jgi:hypothetical protein
LTGGAFPEGGAIINGHHHPYREKPKALQCAHTLKGTRLLCCAAHRAAQRITIYASRFGFLRALHLNAFEQLLDIVIQSRRPESRKNSVIFECVFSYKLFFTKKSDLLRFC